VIVVHVDGPSGKSVFLRLVHSTGREGARDRGHHHVACYSTRSSTTQGKFRSNRVYVYMSRARTATHYVGGSYLRRLPAGYANNIVSTHSMTLRV